MKTSRASKSSPSNGGAPPLSVLADEGALSAVRRQTGLFSRVWAWLRTRRLGDADSGRLHVAETVSLGEKRFVAVVQVARRHFLVAGGPTSIVLLAQLDTNEPFEDILKKTMTIPGKQMAKRKRTVKRKPAAKSAGKQDAQPAAPTDQPQTAHFNASDFRYVLHKTVAAGGKRPGKRKPGKDATQENPPTQAPSANRPQTSQFNVPDTFGYGLQQTLPQAGQQSLNGVRQENERSGIEQAGHYA